VARPEPLDPFFNANTVDDRAEGELLDESAIKRLKRSGGSAGGAPAPFFQSITRLYL
jgi:hypothetical protein